MKNRPNMKTEDLKITNLQRQSKFSSLKKSFELAFFMLVLVFLGNGEAFGQVVVDPASSGSATSGTTVTVAHSTGTANNMFMLVGISTRARTVTSVVYGEDPLELVGSEVSNNEAVTYIYKLLSPPSGLDNVVVTFAGGNLGGGNAGIVGVMTFSNVDQNNPIGTYTSGAASSTSPSIILPLTATNNIVFNVLAVTDDSTITLNSVQTQRWLVNTAGDRPIGAGYTKAGVAGSTLMSYTLGTSRRWSLSGVAINPTPIADLAITKTVNNTTPYIGQAIAFTLTASNSGPENSLNTVVYDILPTGYTYTSHSTVAGTFNAGTGVWDIGTLNSGISATLIINAVLNSTGNYNNTANITGDVIDNTPGNNTATISITACLAGGTAPLFKN